MTELRICFVGDSLVLGTNDDHYLGWPGRLAQAERANGHDVTVYNLGLRGDTSEMVAARWRVEAQARLPDIYPGALVFSFGANDCADEDGHGIRVPLDRSVAVARGMIASAAAWKPTLWVGPPPVDDLRMPYRPAESISYHFMTEHIRDLNAAFTTIAAELDVPYLDLFSRLVDDPGWPGMYEEQDGVHPIAGGYEIMAEHIGAWKPWRAWFG